MTKMDHLAFPGNHNYSYSYLASSKQVYTVRTEHASSFTHGHVIDINYGGYLKWNTIGLIDAPLQMINTSFAMGTLNSWLTEELMNTDIKWKHLISCINVSFWNSIRSFKVQRLGTIDTQAGDHICEGIKSIVLNIWFLHTNVLDEYIFEDHRSKWFKIIINNIRYPI